MKVSDYIISFLENKDIKDVFLLAGGGFMHTLDSLAKSSKIRKYYNLHEQACGFCADGYSIYTGKPGVCFVTTGPGGTNTVTAVASSFIDSTPIIYISGQVKTSDISCIPGVRQTGAQEADIISIVKPITKYAVTVRKEDELRYHLEKAFFLAQHERPGPVWLEMPLDIQSKNINLQEQKKFNPSEEGYLLSSKLQESDIENIYKIFNKSKRPVIMAGIGIRLSHTEELFIQLVRKLNIPVVFSRRLRDLLLNEDYKYNFGCVGVSPDRYANYIIQNSDFMLSIGSGLRYYNTAYNDNNFALNATRIIVNIDNAELEKLDMKKSLKICTDAKIFLEAMLSYQKNENLDRSEWFNYCNIMKNKYPRKNEYIPQNYDIVNPYMLTHYIGEYMGDSDVLVLSPSAFIYACTIPYIHGNQRVISHIGLGSMGTALPEAIGACIASENRTIVCEGDGSLQHNIQELALLRQYNLPIKLFVDANQGYRQIYTMQNAHFNGRHAGCTTESGISFPNMELLAQAYRLRYIRIDNSNCMEERVKEALSDDEPTLIEVLTTMDMEFLPVIKSKMNKDGTMQTPSLELLYPFLSDEEHEENMKISRDFSS